MTTRIFERLPPCSLDLSEDAHAVALSRTPYVEVLVPSRYRTDGIDRALADLAPAMKEHLADGRPCL